MSDRVNPIVTFFNYLTNNGKNIDDVRTEADANGDGIVTQNEFGKYIKSLGNLFETDNEIKQIYNLFDTNKGKGKISGTKLNNKYALDDKEMVKMQEEFDIKPNMKKFKRK